MLAIVLSVLIFSSVTTWSQEYDVDFPRADTLQNPLSESTAKVPSDSLLQYVEIGRIFVVGNKITHDNIILRELSVKTGDIIYRGDLNDILDKDRKKLYNTRLFNTVEIRTLELQSNKVELLIDLDERWYTFPAPIFELSDRNFNEWWQNYNHSFKRVNYGLKLYQYNLRGRNETLRLTAQFGFQRVLNLVYRIPYIDAKQKHGLVLEFDFSETKNLAYHTVDHKLDFYTSEDVLKTTQGGGISYTYRNSFYNVHALTAEFRQSEIRDTIAKLNPEYFGNARTLLRYFAASYQFTHDHRDIAAYPLSGNHFAAFIQNTGFGNDGFNKFETSLAYSRFLKLGKNWYFSNHSYGYWSTPNETPYAFYSALGYKKQFVRGYEIFVIEGPQFALNKATLKKLIFSNTYHWDAWPIEQFRHVPIAIYLKTYVDFAYVTNYPNYANNRLSDTLLSGAGGGIDIVGSYDVVLRLEYTFNKQGVGGFFFHLKKEF